MDFPPLIKERKDRGMHMPCRDRDTSILFFHGTQASALRASVPGTSSRKALPMHQPSGHEP